MGSHIQVLLHLQAHEGIDVAGQEPQAVVAAQLLNADKLVGGAAALEAVALENVEGSGDIQAVDIHHAGLLDHMVGVVGLVDGDRHPVGGVSDLGHGVDDEAVVLGAVVGGDHIQAVADVEQGGQIVLVGGLILTGQILLAQLVGHGLDLGAALVVQGGADAHGGIGEAQVLALGQDVLHDLRSHGRPGAVFNNTNGAVLVVALGKMVNKLPHKGENICIIGGGGKHKLTVTEGILHRFGHIYTGQIIYNHLGATVCL